MPESPGVAALLQHRRSRAGSSCRNFMSSRSFWNNKVSYTSLPVHEISTWDQTCRCCLPIHPLASHYQFSWDPPPIPSQAGKSGAVICEHELYSNHLSAKQTSAGKKLRRQMRILWRFCVLAQAGNEWGMLWLHSSMSSGTWRWRKGQGLALDTQKPDLIDWKMHWSRVGFDDLGDLSQPQWFHGPVLWWLWGRNITDQCTWLPSSYFLLGREYFPARRKSYATVGGRQRMVHQGQQCQTSRAFTWKLMSTKHQGREGDPFIPQVTKGFPAAILFLLI